MWKCQKIYQSILSVVLLGSAVSCKTTTEVETQTRAPDAATSDQQGDKTGTNPNTIQGQNTANPVAGSQTTTLDDSRLGEVGKVFNLTMNAAWPSIAQIAGPILGIKIKEAIQKSADGSDNVEINKTFEPIIDISAIPGFQEFTDTKASLKIPRSGLWRIETKADIKAKYELFGIELKKDFEIRIVLSRLAAEVSLTGDLKDITKMNAEDISQPEIAYDIKIEIESVPQQLTDLLVNTFGRKYFDEALDDWTKDVRDDLLKALK
jgi:hypothetical protein